MGVRLGVGGVEEVLGILVSEWEVLRLCGEGLLGRVSGNPGFQNPLSPSPKSFT